MEVTALLLGFLGSLHCLGMCSPLAMAVTSRGGMQRKVAYNTGRIFTYSILGAVVSASGLAFSFVNLQNLLSIAFGTILLSLAAFGSGMVRIPFITSFIEKVIMRLKMLFATKLQRKTLSSIFILGSINGILPCGLSFAALSMCISLAGPLDGFLFMLLFGIGTLPVMLGGVSVGDAALKKLASSHKTIPLMLAISGMLLIIRVFLPHFHQIESFKHVADIVMCR